MKKVPAGPITIKGLDVSHYDEKIDFTKVIGAGFKFCCIKATEGLTVRDSRFANNWAASKAAGMVRGAYHYFHPNKDARAQAEFFAGVVGKLDDLDFLMMDWESTDNVPAQADRDRGAIFLHRLEQLTGKRPVIYTGPYFAQALGLNSGFALYPLWVAHYGTSAPLVPAPWQNWAFWQYSDTGSVPGIPAANEDMDIFNGSLDQLKALIQKLALPKA